MVQLQRKNVPSYSLLNFAGFDNVDSSGQKEIYELLELSTGKKLKAENKHNVHGGFGLRVLDAGNRYAGVAFFKDFTEFYPDCKGAETAAYLSKFVVHPCYRNTGVGEMLLSEARDMCESKGYDSIFLRVDRKNTYAGNGGVKRPIGDFYAKHGDAVKVGIVEGLFGSSAEIYKIALDEAEAADGSARPDDQFFVSLVGGIPEDYDRPASAAFAGAPGILEARAA